MSAVVATLERPERITARTTLTMRESKALDRVGVVESADGGTIHRPTRDERPEPTFPPAGQLTARCEREAVKAAFAPLAEVERKQRSIDAEYRDAAFSQSPGRAKLRAAAEELKEQHSIVRGTARLAYLGTIEAAAKRAGAKYREAAAMVADSAAELEALATLHDELIRKQSTFDPLGVWGRASALLAPPLGYRPSGWSVVSDPYSRDCYWHPMSAGHRDEVRRVQARLRDELAPHLSDTAWPF